MLEFSDLEYLTKPVEIKDSQAPYIQCNEDKQKAVLATIAQEAPSNVLEDSIGIHLGFSVWFNLDLLSVTNSQYAIILDIDPKITHIYKKLQLCFEKAKKPEEFINLFYIELAKDERLLQFPKEYQLEKLKDELAKGYGFLASQENFSRVKKMAMEGRIFWGQADLTNTTHIELIRDWCKINNARIDTLYLSNIPEWIIGYGTEEAKLAMKSNLESLIGTNTSVIDAFYLSNEKNLSGPPQRITQGNIPSFVKKKEEHKKIQHPRKPRVKRSFFQDDSDHSSDHLPKMNELTFLSMPHKTNKKEFSDDLDSFFAEDKENISPNTPTPSASSLTLNPQTKIQYNQHRKPLLSTPTDENNLSLPAKTSTYGFGMFDTTRVSTSTSPVSKKNKGSEKISQPTPEAFDI